MSLAATVLNSIRVKNELLDKNEHRLSEYGAFDFFVQQSMSNPLLTDEMKQQAIRSMGKTLQMPVINYDGSVSVSNVRSCTVADAENTSALATVTFATYAVGFTVVPAMYSNNEIDMQMDIERKYMKVHVSLAQPLIPQLLQLLRPTRAKYSPTHLSTLTVLTLFRFLGLQGRISSPTSSL
jgi:hypothetical protein